MHKIICVIPARYGSTRLHAKPLVNICGRPLIYWVWKQAKKVKLLSEVIVATDDKRIFDTAVKFGGKAMMTSRSCKSGSDRVAEVARKVKCDIVVNLQGDEPMLLPSTIEKSVKALLNDNSAVASTPVAEFGKNGDWGDANQAKAVFDENQYAIYFSRSVIPSLSRAEKGTVPFRTFGLYVFRSWFLKKFVGMKQGRLEKIEKLEQLRILENGYKIKVALVKDCSLDVDVPEDIKLVEKMMKKQGK